MPTERVMLEQEAFTGMRDSVDPTTHDPRKAQVLQNVYPQDPELGGGLVGRPGFDALPATPSQLGAPGARRGQRSYQFNELDGTRHTIVFVGGRMYEYDWGADTFTDRSANQPTTSSTAKIYCVTFANQMVVNDGSNPPWMWDGSGSAAPAFTVLTNAPSACFGPPAIYYAKLVWIDDGNRTDIQWSEENQPNVGYDSGTYDNVWTLGQTDQEQLTALKATNEALYYFRQRSIGSITGRVTPEFRADGVREGVSETIGTNSPDAVVFDDDHIHFMDIHSRINKIVPGVGVVPLWKDLRELTASLPESGLPNATAVLYPQPGLLMFGVQEGGSSENSALVTFARDRDDEYAGIWRGFTFTSIDCVEDADGEPFLFHLTDDGYVYQHGNPDGQKWNDNFQDTPAAIQHVVRGSPLAHNKRLELHFDRIHIIHRTPGTMTNIELNYITPNGGAGSRPTYTITGGTTLWDQFLWDTGVWAVGSGEKKITVGINGRGRWIQPELVHAQTDEQFGFLGWDVEAYLMTEEAAAA